MGNNNHIWNGLIVRWCFLQSYKQLRILYYFLKGLNPPAIEKHLMEEGRKATGSIGRWPADGLHHRYARDRLVHLRL